MKPALSNERMSNRVKTSDVATEHPLWTPLDFLTMLSANGYLFFWYAWDPRTDWRPCAGVNFVSGGGLKETLLKQRHWELQRLEEAGLQKQGGTLRTNPSYWRYFRVYQQKNHQYHHFHHHHSDPSCLVVHHWQRPLRRQSSLNFKNERNGKKERSKRERPCSHSMFDERLNARTPSTQNLFNYCTMTTTTKLLPLPLLLHTTIRRQ